jgi:hypothetical protein
MIGIRKGIRFRDEEPSLNLEKKCFQIQNKSIERNTK